MSPFCGTTGTPVLDIWWCLLWVSKPEWAALIEIAEAYMFHVPWDSPPVQHLPTSWWPAWQPSHLFHIPTWHWWDSKPGVIMPPLTVWDQADALPTELSQLGPTGSFRVCLFIELGYPSDLGKCSGCFMIIRWPINWFVYQWHHFTDITLQCYETVYMWTMSMMPFLAAR